MWGHIRILLANLGIGPWQTRPSYQLLMLKLGISDFVRVFTVHKPEPSWDWVVRSAARGSRGDEQVYTHLLFGVVINH